MQLNRSLSPEDQTHLASQLADQICEWAYRIRDDPKIYQHLFTEGQFWYKPKLCHSLLAGGGERGFWIVAYFMLIECNMLMGAAMYQVLVNPDPNKGGNK